MTLEIRGLDVFTDRPFTGNPTAVVLNADDLSPVEMQAVARELNLETTFVIRSGSRERLFELRYFMPLCEVELCGHGTIGAIWALVTEGVIPQGLSELTVGTRVGPLQIGLEWENGGLKKVLMDQLLPESGPPGCSAEEVAQVLGIPLSSITTVRLPMAVCSTGRAKLLVPVGDWQTLDGILPSGEALEALCRRIGVTGLYPFTLEPRNSNAAAEARQFPCGGGVVEDPVTGVAACALGAYLVERRAVRIEGPVIRILIEQGHAIGRPGAVEVYVYVENSAIVRTRIAGRAVPISRTEMRHIREGKRPLAGRSDR
ncbi:MAG TPA: PhzF family phenazine biosynthesis isomerase [Thermoflexia bacterium]|nr:PhzF family phenazine biosynthesis isomerase [Thermoflexia bacterium]